MQAGSVRDFWRGAARGQAGLSETAGAVAGTGEVEQCLVCLGAHERKRLEPGDVCGRLAWTMQKLQSCDWECHGRRVEVRDSRVVQAFELAYVSVEAGKAM